MIIVTDPNEAALQALRRAPVGGAHASRSCSATRRSARTPGNERRRRHLRPHAAVGRRIRCRQRSRAETSAGAGRPPARRALRDADRDRRRRALRRPADSRAGDIPNIQTATHAGGADERGPDRAHERQERRRARGHARRRRARWRPARRRSTSRPARGCGCSCSTRPTIRYMRLRLTDNAGTLIPLVRVGGEGGLLDNAVVEGGVIGAGFDTKYNTGEILLARAAGRTSWPRSPRRATGVLTLWTEDYQRTGPAALLEHPDRPGHAPQRHGLGSRRTRSQRHRRFAPRPATPCQSLGAAPTPLLDPTTFSPAKAGFVRRQNRPATRSTEHPTHADRRPAGSASTTSSAPTTSPATTRVAAAPRARRATPRSATCSS